MAFALVNDYSYRFECNFMENITFGCIFPALTLVFVANIVNSKLHQIRSQHRPPAVIWKKMLWLGSMRVFDDENKRKKKEKQNSKNSDKQTFLKH